MKQAPNLARLQKVIVIRYKHGVDVGRDYFKELTSLGPTLEWAKKVPIKSLAEFVADAHGRPLIAVGSGGSATAAHLAALLHRARGCGFSKHATPLDVLLTESELCGSAVL